MKREIVNKNEKCTVVMTTFMMTPTMTREIVNKNEILVFHCAGMHSYDDDFTRCTVVIREIANKNESL
jgi:hypothetical protein